MDRSYSSLTSFPIQGRLATESDVHTEKKAV